MSRHSYRCNSFANSAVGSGSRRLDLLRAGRATEVWLDLFGDAFVRDESDDPVVRREDGRRDLQRHLQALEKNLSSEKYDEGVRNSIARVREALQKYL